MRWLRERRWRRHTERVFNDLTPQDQITLALFPGLLTLDQTAKALDESEDALLMRMYHLYELFEPHPYGDGLFEYRTRYVRALIRTHLGVRLPTLQ